MEKMTQDFNNEKETISNLLKESRTKESELEKALAATKRDITTLEGRMIEITAVLSYLEGMSAPASEEADGEVSADEDLN